MVGQDFELFRADLLQRIYGGDEQQDQDAETAGIWIQEFRSVSGAGLE